jgi:tetratricopeptide (TPR) repeat protein
MSHSPSGVPDKFAHLMEKAAAQQTKYVRAVSPRLRILLYFVFALFALLSANGIYLSSITFAQWLTQRTYEDHFYQLMMLVHLGLGLMLILPVIVFGILHLLKARTRRNRRAVRVGYLLFAISLIVLVTGVLLMRVGEFSIRAPQTRTFVYWAHILAPLGAVWLYWMHRLAGPKIKWWVGGRVAIATAVVVAFGVLLQMHDPRIGDAGTPKDGERYFEPSFARTKTGKFISAEVLMNDRYCLDCHPDVYNSWVHSAHKNSSFNNPAYLATIRETRRVSLERDGNVQATRFCAGCHDLVPFFSGAFDDPKFNDVSHPTAHAGIGCVSCHSIQSIGQGDPQREAPPGTLGNGDYVIDEPKHYPFTYTDNKFLKRLNHLLVKAKPAFHKSEMLKPFHKTAEFCSSCHKVQLPKELTKYKDFLRGQNHYDTYLLSGVSGHGARSFYYPPIAQDNCNGCHMPEFASNDFGAKPNKNLGTLAIKDHAFPAANSAVAWWMKDEALMAKHEKILKECCRVDLFGIREDGAVDGRLIAPLRPQLPELEPGKTYLIESVVRTLKMGHPLTQGTTDSNELWLDLEAVSDGKVIGRSGGLDETQEVDPWSHFINVFMLDRYGNRIDRRNAQDIFTPLYNHQIPPGAGQTVHYRLRVPETISAPIELKLKLRYRKFDKRYMDYITQSLTPQDHPFRGITPGQAAPNPLPIITMAEDQVTLPIKGIGISVPEQKREVEPWQRWNDYGIGMLLKGKAELKQAFEAFVEVEKLGRSDGALNQARASFEEGDLDDATAAVQRSMKMEPPPPAWTTSWLAGIIDRQQGNLQQSVESLRGVLKTKVPERRFDFSRDYMIRNELGLALIDLAEQAHTQGKQAEYEARLREARDEFLTVLKEDSEDVTAHANLAQVFTSLGEPELAKKHGDLHLRYKPDDNAEAMAKIPARNRYPAADHAAEAVVIYDLQRELEEK